MITEQSELRKWIEKEQLFERMEDSHKACAVEGFLHAIEVMSKKTDEWLIAKDAPLTREEKIILLILIKSIKDYAGVK